MKQVTLWAVVVLAILVGAYLVGLFVAARLSAPDRQLAERTPADAGLAYREVGFETTDTPGGRVFGKVVTVHIPILPTRQELLERVRAKGSVAPIKLAGYEDTNKAGTLSPQPLRVTHI